ncbi:tetratricopeptide repeat protein [Dysgonomonas sp. 520]|nr:tetratricopeptide repeat protein [Dysgonomonas sp. 520]
MRNILLSVFIFFSLLPVSAQVIDTDKVMVIGRNALYYEDYVLAIQYFNQVVKAKPYLAEPYFYRGLSKYFLEDFKGAEEDFDACIKRNPFISRSYYLRGDSRLNTGDYDGAIVDYDKSLDMIPDEKMVLINMSIAYIKKKDFNDAEKTLDKLLDLNPTYVQGFLTRGSMFLEKGDTIQAKTNYNKALELDPYNTQTYSMLGLLNYQQKKYDDALTNLNEAIRLDPLIVGNYINRGLVYYAQDNYRSAMDDYNKVVDLEPNNIIGRFNRALLRAQVGDINNAITDFDVVLAAEPDNNMAYLNRAMLKYQVGNYTGAIADLNKVLDEYPDYYEGFYTRADMKRKLKDTKGAEEDLRYAQAEEERIRRAVLSGKEPAKKESTKTREKSDRSIENFNSLVTADKEEQENSKYTSSSRGRVQNQQVSLDLAPIFVATYYQKLDDVKNFVHYDQEILNLNNKGILPQKLKITNAEMPLTEDQVASHFASIDNLSMLIDSDKENAELYFARSVDYMLIQDFDNAIQDLTKATTIKPDFILAQFNLGVLYTKQMELKEKNRIDALSQTNTNALGDKTPPSTSAGLPIAGVNTDKPEFNQAIKCYDKILQLDPKFTYAYYNRACLKAEQRDYRGAILDFNEAIRLENEFPQAYFNRGICQLYIGEKDKGVSDLRKAGELGVVSSYAIIKRVSK